MLTFRSYCENYVRYKVLQTQETISLSSLLFTNLPSLYSSEKLEWCQPYRVLILQLSETMEVKGFSNVKGRGEKIGARVRGDSFGGRGTN